MALLVHRVRELDAGDRLLQNILERGGVGLLYLCMTDDAGQHRGVEERLRRARTRDDDLVEVIGDE